VKGLVARGGFVVDISWKNGKLVSANILSKLGEKTKLKYGGKIIDFASIKGKSYKFNQNLDLAK
ncbi:MAG TPA: hypothetical protein PKY82_34515, partial [Pyrinomonadaceae bacterium]|nr:hypothetical protein [Pyrinomonadaceae bacterium]